MAFLFIRLDSADNLAPINPTSSALVNTAIKGRFNLLIDILIADRIAEHPARSSKTLDLNNLLLSSISNFFRSKIAGHGNSKG